MWQMKFRRKESNKNFRMIKLVSKKHRENDPVYVPDVRTKHWEPAMIIKPTETPSSYIVQDRSGKHFD